MCEGAQVVQTDDGFGLCPRLAATSLGSVACRLPGGSFDAKKTHRDIQNAKMQKDKAYRERNLVVAALARAVVALGGRAGRKKTHIEGWNPAWDGCVYLDLPNGMQVSWHYHSDHDGVFDFLPPYEGEWDGHDTPTKYQRLEEWRPC